MPNALPRCTIHIFSGASNIAVSLFWVLLLPLESGNMTRDDKSKWLNSQDLDYPEVELPTGKKINVYAEHYVLYLFEGL